MNARQVSAAGGRTTFPGLSESYRWGYQGRVRCVYTKGITVPGKINNLVPPSAMKPKVSPAGAQSSSQAKAPYVPRFGRPAILVPDDFWSNLKQFLTERPIKVRERKDAPFTRRSFGSGLAVNLAEFFRRSEERRVGKECRSREARSLEKRHKQS